MNAKSIIIEDIKIENQTGWLQIFSLRIDLPNFVLNWFNSTLKTVIHAGLLNRYETIDLATLYQDLPDMPDGDAYKLPIELKAIKILTPGVLAMAGGYSLTIQGGMLDKFGISAVRATSARASPMRRCSKYLTFGG